QSLLSRFRYLFHYLHHPLVLSRFFFFFFTDPAPTEIYTLSLHDALPIYLFAHRAEPLDQARRDAKLILFRCVGVGHEATIDNVRSEEHTSELQSQSNLVCRLLLEKKKKKKNKKTYTNKEHKKRPTPALFK